eukprot:scaffold325627_cov72-Tisochrysis_lutea.AAC.2
MQSLTQHAPSTCLSQSDLAGLRALYPVCDMQLSPEVICVKVSRAMLAPSEGPALPRPVPLTLPSRAHAPAYSRSLHTPNRV